MALSFSLIILSAFFHSSWNILLKNAINKHSFTVQIHFAASVMMTVILAVFFPEAFRFDKVTVIFAICSAFFFSFYQIFVAEAYKCADVSMVYPITTSSPLFIIVWAYFLLGERMTLAGFCGIILILSGCYIMNMTKGSNKLAFKGILMAVLAALFYSFGAMADKMGVTSVNTLLYIYLMTVFMTFFIAFFVGISPMRSKLAQVQWKLVTLGGLALLGSTVCYRLGLINMQIAYATSLRQVSSFFGLLMGIFFFKESYGIKRAIGCAVIISGIVLIRLGI